MKNFFIGENLSLKSQINVIIIVSLICGVIGYINEVSLYYINYGILINRGTSFGPIIPIYVYGSLLMIFFTYRFKAKPIIIFLINSLMLGSLEYLVGFFIYRFSGFRLWDYRDTFLNIDGFVCLKSVIFFGIGSLVVIYLLTPFIIKQIKKYNEKKVSIISYILFIIFIVDIISYLIIKIV